MRLLHQILKFPVLLIYILLSQVFWKTLLKYFWKVVIRTALLLIPIAAIGLVIADGISGWTLTPFWVRIYLYPLTAVGIIFAEVLFLAAQADLYRFRYNKAITFFTWYYIKALYKYVLKPLTVPFTAVKRKSQLYLNTHHSNQYSKIAAVMDKNHNKRGGVSITE